MAALTSQTSLGNINAKGVGYVSNSYKSEILYRPENIIIRPDEIVIHPDELYIVRTI